VVLIVHTFLLFLVTQGDAEALWPVWAVGLVLALGALGVMLPALRDARVLLMLHERPLAELSGARSHELAPTFEAVASVRSRVIALEAGDEAALDKLRTRERLATSFLGSMGHDLRGPLNNILGFAELMVMQAEQEGAPTLGPAQRPSVDIIRRAAHDMLVLLDQVLAWAKLQKAPPVLDRKQVALSELMTEVRAQLERRLAGRALTLDTRELPALSLLVDGSRCVEALLGLLDPCVRALGVHEPRTKSAQRGERIVVRARNEPDDETSRASGPRLLLELTDSSLRIRDPDREGFFEAFRPSFAPSGKRIAGLGLGPALARALIRAHGGDVWLTSRPDQGTTFTIALPIA
jgi:signal transduction histidine kinase